MPINPVLQWTGKKLIPAYTGEVSEKQVQFGANLVIPAGQVVAQVTADSANEVQTLDFTGTVSGGTFILSILGIDGISSFPTTALAYNISNANLRTAILAMLSAAGYPYGSDVTITGGASPTDVNITFGGTLAYTNVPLIVATGSVTGGGSVAVTATTAGTKKNTWGKYDSGASNGLQTARALAVYDFRTDHAGQVIYGGANSTPEHNLRELTGLVYTKGRFLTGDLVGLDATAAGQLGRLENGSITSGVLALI